MPTIVPPVPRLYPGDRVYLRYGFPDLPPSPPDVMARIPAQGADHPVVALRTEQLVTLEWWHVPGEDPGRPQFAAAVAELGLTLTAVDAQTQRVGRFLAAHPTTTGNPGGTVVLPLGRVEPVLSTTGAPEVFRVLGAGPVDVVED